MFTRRFLIAALLLTAGSDLAALDYLRPFELSNPLSRSRHRTRHRLRPRIRKSRRK